MMNANLRRVKDGEEDNVTDQRHGGKGRQRDGQFVWYNCDRHVIFGQHSCRCCISLVIPVFLVKSASPKDGDLLVIHDITQVKVQ